MQAVGEILFSNCLLDSSGEKSVASSALYVQHSAVWCPLRKESMPGSESSGLCPPAQAGFALQWGTDYKHIFKP